MAPCCVLEQDTFAHLVNTQEVVGLSRHDRKMIDWDVKPQYKQTNKKILANGLISYLSCTRLRLTGILEREFFLKRLICGDHGACIPVSYH